MKDSENHLVTAGNVPISTPLITTDGQAFDIPIEGNLGLLAMGYVGMMLWRQKRYTAPSSTTLNQETL